MLDTIVTNKDIKVVALSFFGSYFLDVPFNANHKAKKWKVNISSRSDDTSKDKLKLFKYGLDSAIDALENSGKQIVLLLPPPELPFLPRDCLRNPFLDCQLLRSTVLENQSLNRQITAELQAKHKNLFVFDPLDLFCDKERCHYGDEDSLFFYDALHLTVRGSKYYAEHFLMWLKSKGLQ